MDWITEWRAELTYQPVGIRPSNGPEWVTVEAIFNFQGTDNSTKGGNKMEAIQDVPPEELGALPGWVSKILERYPELVRTGLPDGIPTGDVEHKIEINEGAAPPNKAMYRQSRAEQEETRRQVTDSLQSGKIQRSSSAYSTSVVLVRQPTGKYRFCIDYRALNGITKKDRFPMPRMDDLRDQIKGAQIFSKIDIAKGYWNVRMAVEDREKTAFKTNDGLFEWTCMPFGLCNAPSTFQHHMQRVLPGGGQYTVVYLDDILVYSKTLGEHMRHVEAVITKLAEHHLYPNFTKSEFGKEVITYLGHLLSPDEVRPDPNKIETIKSWPCPLTSVKDVRSFHGLASYYRKFIPGFAKMANEITKLLAGRRRSSNGPRRRQKR
eukprot:GHVS01104994.1.p1 GENE.GHVS01104994.1~~GHVS01104994.1.p1  ORF type:complete len:377 (+),score=8.18 GHVS01104994.1:430-1560(+)